MTKQYSLYGRLLEKKALLEAYRRVRRNNGSHGVDKQTVKEFGGNLEENLNQLLTELKEKSYQPLPVRRVEIDKDDGGKRKLGIPSARDRVVQQAVLNLLEPLFDPECRSRIRGPYVRFCERDEGETLHPTRLLKNTPSWCILSIHTNQKEMR